MTRQGAMARTGLLALALGLVLGAVLVWRLASVQTSPAPTVERDLSPPSGVVRTDGPSVPDGVGTARAERLGETVRTAVPGRPGQRSQAGGREPPFATLTGRVVGPDGSPVSGAEVLFAWDPKTLAGLNERLARRQRGGPMAAVLLPEPRARTAADGRFTLDIVGEQAPRRSGLLVVRGGADGLRVRRCAAVVAGANPLGELLLEAGAVVLGRAVDPDGMPVSGVGVRVEIESPVRGEVLHRDVIRAQGLLHVARTGEDGVFRVAGLPPGVASVALDPVQRRAVTVLNVALDPLRPADLGDVTLDAGAAIEGWLLYPDDRAAAGVVVTASATDAAGSDRLGSFLNTGRTTGTATAGPDGHFVIQGLANGVFSLHAIARGYVWSRVHGVHTGGEPARLVLREPGVILVSVLDRKDGAPVEGASLNATLPAAARKQIWSAWQYTTATGNGAGLGPGQIRVTGAGAEGTMLTVRAPGYAPETVEVGSLEPGESVSVDVRLRGGRAARGTVRGLDGLPVAGAAVEARPGTDVVAGSTLRVVTDNLGVFELTGLDAGHWSLSAAAEGYLASGSVELALDHGDQDDLVVVLLPSARIEGTVRGAAGTPGGEVAVFALRGPGDAAAALPGAALAASQPDRGRAWAPTAANGSFVLDELGAGDYLLMASGVAAETAWGRLELAAASVDVRLPPDVVRVALSTGGQRTVDLTLARPASLRGRVLADGRAVAKASVTVLSERGLRFARVAMVACDEGGVWELAGLPPGDYAVVAASAREVLPRAARISLAEGEDGTVDLEFAGFPLSGRVIDESSGEVAAGVPIHIRVRNADEADASTVYALGRPALIAVRRREAPFDFTIRADREGRFTFAHIPAGRYLLDAYGDGWLRHQTVEAVALTDGPTAKLTLTTARGAVVEGEVHAAPGGRLPSRLAVELRRTGQDGVLAWTWVEQGQYRFQGLSAHSYEVRVAQKIGSGKTLDTHPIDVRAGEVHRLDFRLDAAVGGG